MYTFILYLIPALSGLYSTNNWGIISVMKNNLVQIKDLLEEAVLTQEQKEILVGTLLGDAFMESTTEGRTWRLGIEQGHKQKFYVFKKHEILQSLSPEMEQVRGKGNVYEKYAFWTPRLSCLKPFGDLFYKKVTKEDKKIKFVKVVPKQIDKWLTPRGLAFWYMDDGSIKSKDHKLVYLNTQGFTREENERLAQLLEKKFGLNTFLKHTLSKDTGKVSIQIAIHGDSLEDLRKLIEPYMYPEVKQLPTPKRVRGRGKKTLAREAELSKASTNQRFVSTELKT